MTNKWEELIQKEKQYAEEIKGLVKKHNITVRMLTLAIKLGAPNIAADLRRKRISEKKYRVLKSGIDKILSKQISKEEIYTQLPRRNFRTVSSSKLKSLLKKNNLTVKSAAEKAELNFDYLNSLLKEDKIPEKTYSKLIRRLKIK